MTSEKVVIGYQQKLWITCENLARRGSISYDFIERVSDCLKSRQYKMNKINNLTNLPYVHANSDAYKVGILPKPTTC